MLSVRKSFRPTVLSVRGAPKDAFFNIQSTAAPALLRSLIVGSRRAKTRFNVSSLLPLPFRSLEGWVVARQRPGLGLDVG